MKTNKLLTATTIIVISIFSTGVLACEKNEKYEFEHAVSVLKSKRSNKLDTESYDFKVSNCVPVTSNDKDIEQNTVFNDKQHHVASAHHHSKLHYRGAFN